MVVLVALADQASLVCGGYYNVISYRYKYSPLCAKPNCEASQMCARMRGGIVGKRDLISAKVHHPEQRFKEESLSRI